MGARLPIGAREQNFPVQRLQAPTRSDEPAREIIEQLRVRRPPTQKAKIARCIHNSRAEVVLPYTVCQHPRRERMIVPHDPLAERAAALAFGRIGLQGKRGHGAIHHRRTRRHHPVTGLQRITALVHERLFLGLRILASPDLSQRWYRLQRPIHFGNLRRHRRKLPGLGRRRDFGTRPLDAVGLTPGFASRARSHRPPGFPVGRDLNRVVGWRRSLRLVFDHQALRITERNAVDRLGLCECDRQHCWIADEPLLAESPVDREVRSVGLRKILRHRRLRALGPRSVARQRDIARALTGTPCLELHDPRARGRLRIRGARTHNQLHRPHPHRLKTLLGQLGVHLRPRRDDLRRRLFRAPRDFPLEHGALRDPFRPLLVQRPRCGLERRALLRRRHDAAPVRHTLKRRAQPVIVLRGDRIEFVVVAARTVDRHPQKRPTRRRNEIVEGRRANILPSRHILITDVVVRPGDEKRAADFSFRPVLTDQIAGEMFDYELIERLVVVERADHVVAKRPEIVDEKIPLETIALTKANDVEPVPPPALAVGR